ncbi:hypothetical protein MRX96_003613 [Rhipicephalus microplus]
MPHLPLFGLVACFSPPQCIGEASPREPDLNDHQKSDTRKSHDAEGDNAQVMSQDTQVQGPNQHCLATRSLQAKEPGVPELQNEMQATAATPGTTTEA